MTGIIALYFIGAALLVFIPKKVTWLSAKIIALLQLVVFTWLVLHAKPVIAGVPIETRLPWIPGLGLEFAFILDGLSLLFALLVSGIGFLVFLFAHGYMKKYEGKRRFYIYLTVFSGAMMGLVLSANFIQLFVFWELTSVLSFLLISFFNEKADSRKAAFQSLFVTGAGGLSLLSGLILLSSISGSFMLNDWVEAASVIKSDSRYTMALILILVGAFTKSAQFPFHFWLPGAMQAPTPVSAYLHSATMVKAGVFLLARLNPILAGTVEWTYIIPFVGALTMFTGAYLSVTQTDMKAVLAYTTISALGILMLLIGIDTKLSLKAAMVFLYVHALYKAALFMLAGYIDKRTGTRDINKLGGLAKHVPLVFFVACIALFSMAGLPPFLGFIGKELIYEAKVQSPGIASLMLIMGVTSNILMVTVSLYLMAKVFLGQQKIILNKIPNNAFMLAGPMVLALFSLGLGMAPKLLSVIIEPALSVMLNSKVDIKLKLWHGFNKVFYISVFTVISGVIVFGLLFFKKGLVEKWRRFNNYLTLMSFSDVFSAIIDGFVKLSGRNTRFIQHGYHRHYLFTVLFITGILLSIQLYFTRGWQLSSQISFQPFYITGLVLIISVAAIFSVISRSRLFTIVNMGVVGYGISLIYMYYSAIDLAITQIIIETLTVVVFVLILQRMPLFARLSSVATRIRDALLALFFGGIMTVLALKAINIDFNYPISDFFTKNSYSKAYGENVVNVILVDFRALDTFGEVIVLTIAALGVFVLLKTKTQRP